MKCSLLKTVSIVSAAALAAGSCFSDFEKPQKTLDKPAPSAAAGANKNPPPRKKKQEQDQEKEQQSYAQAWAVICNAERLAGADPNASRAERGRVVAHWIVKNLKNKRARYWFIGLNRVEKQKRKDKFQAEALRGGQKDCALVELLYP